MPSQQPSTTVDDVNVAILEAFGYKPISSHPHIKSAVIRLEACELPTIAVEKYIGIGDETVQEMKRLRLREVTGDGM